ncbi:MAG: RNA-binding protein [Betaproteobacteria bacterium]
MSFIHRIASDTAHPLSAKPPRMDVEDISVWRDRLHALFSQHGHVSRLDLVRADQSGQRRLLCFLRMANEQEDNATALALGLGRFGGDLVMLISPDEPALINPPWFNALTSARTGQARRA